MTGRKDRFRPSENGVVKMFVCGPTVYDSVHMGHARTYLVYDVLARYLKVQGLTLEFVVNITDIDDKVFEKAEEEGIKFEALADRHFQEFLECLSSLNISSITDFPKASEYLGEIESQIKQLLKKGHAYQVDGNIYFDVSSFAKYGQLSHLNTLELNLRRLSLDPKKRDQRDFVLWRSWRGPAPSFTSIFGLGRPGWHIEDTAMSISLLGSSYDIHGGAVELVFPHHEAELAQGESITGNHPFVKHWVHTGLLTVEGEKMSKSRKNIIVLREALRSYRPTVLRLYLLSRHYREMFDFKMSDLLIFENKESFLKKTVLRLSRLLKYEESSVIMGVKYRFQKHIDSFFKAMNEDLDTPRAIDALMMLMKELDRDMRGVNQDLLNTVLKMITILGLEPSSGE